MIAGPRPGHRMRRRRSAGGCTALFQYLISTRRRPKAALAPCRVHILRTSPAPGGMRFPFPKNGFRRNVRPCPDYHDMDIVILCALVFGRRRRTGHRRNGQVDEARFCHRHFDRSGRKTCHRSTAFRYSGVQHPRPSARPFDVAVAEHVIRTCSRTARPNRFLTNRPLYTMARFFIRAIMMGRFDHELKPVSSHHRRRNADNGRRLAVASAVGYFVRAPSLIHTPLSMTNALSADNLWYPAVEGGRHNRTGSGAVALVAVVQPFGGYWLPTVLKMFKTKSFVLTRPRASPGGGGSHVFEHS